jgi:hypothetical protein
MSHFTKCALKMTNLAAIKKALADLQHQFTEAEEGQHVTVRGYRGEPRPRSRSIWGAMTSVSSTAGRTFDITADWWGVETTRRLEEEFKHQSVSATSITT